VIPLDVASQRLTIHRRAGWRLLALIGLMLIVVFVGAGAFKAVTELLAEHSSRVRRELRWRTGLSHERAADSTSARNTETYNLGRAVRRFMSLTAIILLLVFRRSIPWRWAAHRAFERRHRSRDFCWGLGVGCVTVAIWAVLLLATRQVAWAPRNPHVVLSTALQFSLLGIVVALSEEYFFRGLLFRALLAENLGVVSALALSSAAYGLLHCFYGTVFVRPGWSPYVGLRLLREFFTDDSGSPLPALRLFVGLTLLGLILAYLYLRTGSLWSSVGLHTGLIAANKVAKKCVPRAPEAIEWLVGDREFIVSGVLSWIVALGLLVFVLRFAPRGALYRRFARRHAL
jgi:membrane protease YdiL (CAAX protease family)